MNLPVIGLTKLAMGILGVPFSKILQSTDETLRAKAAAALPHLLEAYGRMMFLDGLFHVISQVIRRSQNQDCGCIHIVLSYSQPLPSCCL